MQCDQISISHGMYINHIWGYTSQVYPGASSLLPWQLESTLHICDALIDRYTEIIMVIKLKYSFIIMQLLVLQSYSVEFL